MLIAATVTIGGGYRRRAGLCRLRALAGQRGGLRRLCRLRGASGRLIVRIGRDRVRSLALGLLDNVALVIEHVALRHIELDRLGVR